MTCAYSVDKMNKYRKRWNVPVPDQLDKMVSDYIIKDTFKTKSEFIRAAVRDRLKQEQKKLEDQP